MFPPYVRDEFDNPICVSVFLLYVLSSCLTCLVLFSQRTRTRRTAPAAPIRWTCWRAVSARDRFRCRTYAGSFSIKWPAAPAARTRRNSPTATTPAAAARTRTAVPPPRCSTTACRRRRPRASRITTITIITITGPGRRPAPTTTVTTVRRDGRRRRARPSGGRRPTGPTARVPTTRSRQSGWNRDPSRRPRTWATESLTAGPCRRAWTPNPIPSTRVRCHNTRLFCLLLANYNIKSLEVTPSVRRNISVQDLETKPTAEFCILQSPTQI